ncbi:MAG: TerB N-terminal domain-containing protein, partial [Oscillospiraceae bacterium]|nr:TerB N-terminal domain-containing protein [Oscillospiraceae bacterium]
MNPWKDLLSKIFPGADANAAPEEIFVPREKPADPVERIHAMRKIKGNSGGFARLYGAKDVEQFARQAEYMRDFQDDYPKEIPFGDNMPTYADMSLAQLRCHFTWRSRARRGGWRDIPYSYVLLYIFELLNTHGEPEKTAARLAECWLEMERRHPKLNAKLPQWFKDYYVCHEFALPFGELATALELEDFFPEPAQRGSLLSLSSYRAQDSRFFRERPQSLPILEQALGIAVKNLAPLFTLHGVNEEETFFMRPARFSFHELYRDAAAQPPALHGNREVRISRSEIVRLRGGAWSRALEDAFRPPSHAVGYAAKRLEGELRRLAGFAAPWNDPEGASLLERWMQAEPAALPLMEDPRLPAILAEAARQAYAPGSPAPVAEALAGELERQPLRSILALRGTPGFAGQGRKLALLEDDYPETAPCPNIYSDYAGMTHAQLRTYLTWRTKYCGGIIERTDPAYAFLYIRELESSIGTQEPLRDLCRFLRAYA